MMMVVMEMVIPFVCLVLLRPSTTSLNTDGATNSVVSVNQDALDLVLFLILELVLIPLLVTDSL